MGTHERGAADDGTLLPGQIVEHKTRAIIAHRKIRAGLSRGVKHDEEYRSSTVGNEGSSVFAFVINEHEMVRPHFRLGRCLLRHPLIGPASQQPERVKFRLQLGHCGSSGDQETQQDRPALHPAELEFRLG